MFFSACEWKVEEVCEWLEVLDLGEYQTNFQAHDIRGEELLRLEKGDLKELGITKVGHLKRIQQAIEELNQQSSS